MNGFHRVAAKCGGCEHERVLQLILREVVKTALHTGEDYYGMLKLFYSLLDLFKKGIYS